MIKVWAGVDTGKAHHHCVVIDAEGRRLLSRRVANDEPELEILIADVAALGEEVTWTTDMAGGGAALLIGLLAAAGQQLLYLPGHALAHAAGGYRGEGKTDARDAAIIADQARMRRDLQPLRPGDEVTAELKILTERRKDLSCDRTRVVNRMRGLLTSIFPALERELSLTSTGPLVLLTGYQAPAAIRSASLPPPRAPILSQLRSAVIQKNRLPNYANSLPEPGASVPGPPATAAFRPA